MIKVINRNYVTVIISIALVLRIIFSIPDYWLVADEVFQYIEPAYALDFGRSIVTWEYRLGMRSYFLPGILAPFVYIGKEFFGDTNYSLLTMRIFLVLFSTSIVYSSIYISKNISKTHAALAGLAMAVSFEPILFASRAISEGIGTNFFFIACAFLERSKNRRSLGLAGGICLGLTLAARLQYAPAAVLAGIFYSRLQVKNFASIAAGGIIGLLSSGVFDVLHGQYPLQWMVENYKYNLILGRSSNFGVSPFGFYFSFLYDYGGPSLIFVTILSAIGARRFPVMALAAIATLLSHSLIGHKEPRFIFLSISIGIFLAAIGTTDVLSFVLSYRRRVAIVASVLLVAVWGVFSVNWAYASVHDKRATAFGLIRAWRELHNEPNMCGLASLTSHNDLKSGNTPTSYAYIDRDIPIYMFIDPDLTNEFSTQKTYFNVILAGEKYKSFLLQEGYSLGQCVKTPSQQSPNFKGLLGLCIYKRSGECKPDSGKQYLENEVRNRMGM